jgi:PAS domain S-box-containing protein
VGSPTRTADGLRQLAERAFLQTTAEGVAIVDVSGHIAVVNAGLARMIGTDEAQLVGRPALEIVTPAGRETAAAALAGATTSAVVPLDARDGATIWVQLASAPLLDDGGANAGTLWLATDVSEWRRSQQALRALADTSRALASALDVAAVAGTVARSIDGGVAIGLLEGDARASMRACAVVDPSIEARLQPLIGRVMPIEPGTLGEEVLRTREPVIIGPEGAARLHPVFAAFARELGMGSLVVVPLLVHGRVIGLMSVFRTAAAERLGPSDLPLLREIADRAAMALERARLFEEQSRTNDRLRLLADAGRLLAQSLEVDPTMIAVARLAVQSFADLCALRIFEDGHSTQHTIATRDHGLEEKVRLAMAPYVGVDRPPTATRRVLDAGEPVLVAAVDEAALRGLAIDEVHLERLRVLGLRSVVVVPLLARGVPLGIVSFARTGGQAYDEDDLALAMELGRRAALAIDNARLFRSANEAIATRDEFLSIASHELNTPLTPLRMQLDSLRRGRFQPDRAGEKLDAASRQVTRLTKLVSELLDVSRIRSGRLHLEPEAFDMAALVDEVVARTSEEAERAGVTFAVRADRPCEGTWDRMRLDQVVTNLLTNAVKYGGGKPVQVDLSRTDAGVRLAVSDRGIGIAPENQRRIFERFERATSARHYGGFGLGLWIARQIVVSSGGAIAVASAPGRGSTFVVELPREPPAP